MTAKGRRAPVGGGPRRKAREFALLGVYQSLADPQASFASVDAGLLPVITDGDAPEAGCELAAEDFEKCDREFYRELLAGVMAERDQLTELLRRHLEREPARISLVERACLMIGAWELLHRMENPYRVVINEAVELTKRFGAEKGYRLVNGVLDRVAMEVRPGEAGAGH